MDKIFAEAAKARGRPREGQDHADAKQEPQPQQTAATSTDAGSLPKGVVLGPDGKPCRTCTDVSAWTALIRQKRGQDSNTSSSSSSPSSTNSVDENDAMLPADCPPDVNRLGRHSWTLLHTMSAQYPERASGGQQADMAGFLRLFAKLYPCWSCASDFREWMARPGNEPRLGGRDDFGRWMCAAHNEVNRKLGKKEFDCDLWRQRWIDGWRDGRCDP